MRTFLYLGFHNSYWENGQKKEEGNYKDGKQDGKYIFSITNY